MPVLAAAALIALVHAWTYTGYVVLRPGTAVPAASLGGLAGADEPSGRFLYTSVVAHRANAFEAVRALVDPGVELVPVRGSAIAGVGWETYASLLERQTDDARRVAAAVALREAGYRVPVETIVAVDLVPSDSPLARAVAGDAILVGVGGAAVYTAEEAYALLREAAGGTVRLAFRERGGGVVEVELPVSRGDGEPVPFGLRLMTRHVIEFPVEIRLEPAGAVGSSAGLMFALALYDELTGGGLEGGGAIAGTGALRLDGTVDSVDGVRQKVIAAMRVKAAAFVLPRANVPDAAPVAKGIALLPVDTFAEAVDAVRRFKREE